MEAVRKYVGNDKAFKQEYLLKIVLDSERVIHPDWIHKYVQLPAPTAENRYRGAFVGVDLAISRTNGQIIRPWSSPGSSRLGREYADLHHAQPHKQEAELGRCIKLLKSVSVSIDPGRKAMMCIEGNGYQRAQAEWLQEIDCGKRSSHREIKIPAWHASAISSSRGPCCSLMSGVRDTHSASRRPRK